MWHRRLKVLKSFAVVLGASWLAACADQVLVAPEPQFGVYYGPETVWYATKNGEMPSVIVGNPFSLAKPDADRVVLDSLRLPLWFQPVRFVPHPIDSKPQGYRLVLFFNASLPGPGGDRACGDVTDVAVDPPGDRTRVTAVFCARDRFISEIDGWAPALGPDNRRFPTFLYEVLAGLLPAHNPFDFPDCQNPLCT